MVAWRQASGRCGASVAGWSPAPESTRREHAPSQSPAQPVATLCLLPLPRIPLTPELQPQRVGDGNGCKWQPPRDASPRHRTPPQAGVSTAPRLAPLGCQRAGHFSSNRSHSPCALTICGSQQRDMRVHRVIAPRCCCTAAAERAAPAVLSGGARAAPSWCARAWGRRVPPRRRPQGAAGRGR